MNKLYEENGIYLLEGGSAQRRMAEAAFNPEVPAAVVLGMSGEEKIRTAVNIMGEAVRRGETVLFVSAVPDVLNDVSETLNRMGLQSLYLQIIQKENGEYPPSARIVRQIRQAMDMLESPEKLQSRSVRGIEEIRQRYEQGMSYLQNYSMQMSRKWECKKSVAELVEMAEHYAASPIRFVLDADCMAVPLSEAEEAVHIFAKAAEACGQARKYVYAEYLCCTGFSEKEKEQTAVLLRETLTLYQQLEEASETLGRLCKIPKADSEKEQMKRMTMTADLMKKCPVCPGKTLEELANMNMEQREPDTQFPQTIQREMEKLSKIPAGTWKYGQKKNKIINLLLKIYPVNQAREILRDFEENPQKTMEEIGRTQVFRDEQGERFLEPCEQGVSQMTRFLKKMEVTLETETDDVKDAVTEVVRKIAGGSEEGKKLLDAARKQAALYEMYAGRQQDAAERVVKNSELFSRNYPDVPKKALFAAWLERMEADRGPANHNQNFYERTAERLESCGLGCIVRQTELWMAEAVPRQKEIIDGFYQAWAAAQLEHIQEYLLQSGEFDCIVLQDKIEQVQKNSRLLREALPAQLLRARFERMADAQGEISSHAEYRILQKLLRSSKITTQDIVEQIPELLRIMFPCMLMSPSAAAECLSSGFPSFDVLLADEHVQAPVYHAQVLISGAKRCMIFDDELPGLSDNEEEEMEIKEEPAESEESVLSAVYAAETPCKILRFRPQAVFPEKRTEERKEADDRSDNTAELTEYVRAAELPESTEGIAEHVAAALEKEGLTVHTHIGSSNSPVDLGVVSRRNPEMYSLGILLDHAECDNDVNAVFDREILYPRMLEQKGWKIYRLHGLNWYNDPQGEIRRMRMLTADDALPNPRSNV